MFDRELTCFAGPGAQVLPLHSLRPDAFEAGLGRLEPEQAGFLRAAGFTAAPGQMMLFPGRSGLAGAVLGLGGDRSPYAHGGVPMLLPEGTSWRTRAR